MTHYGSPAHRAKHFLIKGALMGVVSAGMPWLVGIPKPYATMLFLMAIVCTLWFFVYAVGAAIVNTTDRQTFHQQRVIVHAVTILIVGVAMLAASSELEPAPMWLFFCMMLTALVYPTVAILSHMHHHWQNAREAARGRLQDSGLRYNPLREVGMEN